MGTGDTWPEAFLAFGPRGGSACELFYDLPLELSAWFYKLVPLPFRYFERLLDLFFGDFVLPVLPFGDFDFFLLGDFDLFFLRKSPFFLSF